MMSYFSDQLSRFFSERQISYSRCAADLSIDRSSLYQILHGKRLPANNQIISSLCQYLHLNAAEESALLEAYQITLQGYDHYWAVQNVKDFFHWCEHISAFDSFTPTQTAMPSAWDPHRTVVYGKENVASMASSLIHHFFSEDTGFSIIAFYLPPDAVFLSSVRQALHSCGPICGNKAIASAMQIEWLTPLDNSGHIDCQHHFYNLDVLKEYLRFLSLPQTTSCHYFYQRISNGPENCSTGFPYYLLLPNGVLELARQLDTALYVDSKEVHDKMYLRFQNQWKKTTALFQEADDPLDLQKDSFVFQYDCSSISFSSNGSFLCISQIRTEQKLRTTEASLTDAFYKTMRQLSEI